MRYMFAMITAVTKEIPQNTITQTRTPNVRQRNRASILPLQVCVSSTLLVHYCAPCLDDAVNSLCNNITKHAKGNKSTGDGEEPVKVLDILTWYYTVYKLATAAA